MQAILCDQYGYKFIEGDIPETKETKKYLKIQDGNYLINLKDDKIEIIDGPTEATKIIKSHIKDGNGIIKVTDYFVVEI